VKEKIVWCSAIFTYFKDPPIGAMLFMYLQPLAKIVSLARVTLSRVLPPGVGGWVLGWFVKGDLQNQLPPWLNAER
jgi:hypothetical protein